jgi:hypothetical protein
MTITNLIYFWKNHIFGQSFVDKTTDAGVDHTKLFFVTEAEAKIS